MQTNQNTMEDNNTTNLGDSGEFKETPRQNYLSESQKQLYSATGDYAKYSGFLLYAVTAFSIFGFYKSATIMNQLGSEIGIWFFVPTFVVILLYFFLGRSAHIFGSKIKAAANENNPDHFYKASNHLLAFFQIIGIPMMIFTVLSIVFIFISLIADAGRMF